MNKKLILTLLCPTLLGFGTTQLKAQGAYMDVNIGYNLPLSGQTMLSNSSAYNDDISGTYTSTSESVNLSLGKGFNFGANVGYMFNENIGVDLGLNYLIGSKTTAEEVDITKSTDWNTGEPIEYSDKFTYSLSSNMFSICPSIVLSTGMETFTPYAKFGVEMGFGKAAIEQSYSNTFAGSSTNSSLNEEFSKGIAFGVFGAVGGSYTINDNFSLVGEFNLSSKSWAPKFSETTEYKEDGIDQLPNLTTSEKETEYVKELTYNSEDETNSDVASKATKQFLPYSSFGIKAGIRFNL